MTDSSGDGLAQRIATGSAEIERIRALREDPQWRPGAMRPEDRERLVRVGLEIVLGERAGHLSVSRTRNDSIMVSDERHGFGFPPDAVLGDDPRTVLEHDIEWLVDELCETSVAWAERLPACPAHPGVHALKVEVGDERVRATCPITGSDVRTISY